MAEKINRRSRGVFIISITPFSKNGALDLESADRLIEFYIECGVTGMTILGIMGEAQKLSAQDAIRFSKHVLDRVAGRIPVVVGVSGAGLGNLSDLTKSVMDDGAAGVMVAPMPGLVHEVKIKNYFGEVCRALGDDVPICLQDYPQTTGVNFSVETILDLTRTYAQIVMLKHEDWPGLTKLSQVRAQSGTDDTPRLSILTGNAALFLPLELQRGADGAMTGFAYPEMLVNVVNRYQEGDLDAAENLFDAYLPLVRYEHQLGIGLAIRKEILFRRGIIKSPTVRAPGPALSDVDQAELTRLIERLNVRLSELQ